MTLNPKRVEEIYDRLPQLVVELDPNPADRGPAYLQDLISKVRGYLNEVSVYIQEVIRVKNGLESELEALNSSFEIASNELMATDTRVSGLPAVQDRLAMINVILRTDYQTILDKRREVNEVGYVEKAVRHRHRELEQTMSAIRLQRSLLQTDIRTGAFYGDENINSRGDKWNADIESDEIGRLLAEAEAEVEAELANGNTPPETPLPEAKTKKPSEATKPPKKTPEPPKKASEPPKKAPEPPKPPEPLAQATDDDDDLLSLLGELGVGESRSPASTPASVELLSDYDADVSPEETTMLFCSVCGEPQRQCPGGLVCSNGHGGAPSKETNESPSPEAEPAPKAASKKTSKAKGPAVEEEDPDVAAFLSDEDEFADIFDALDVES